MRIRSIKPEFWQSESVGRLTRDARLVFVGLWSLADDHGRFRADPRFIAGQLFPYDDDGAKVVSRALASLREEGCVVLYESEASHYGAIPGWSRHQKIDRPSKSRLPEPPEIPIANIRESSSSPREPSCEEQGAGSRDMEQGAGMGAGRGLARAQEHPLQVVWNANKAPSMPEWRETSPTRWAHADARLKERDLEAWAAIVKRIAASDFASGRQGGWVASVDWLIKSPNNAAKVLEGNYDNRAGATKPGAPVAAESVDWTKQQTGEIEF